MHWESNGLLDMYRNPKAHYPQLKKINTDDVLIPLWERMVFSSGESCEMGVLCSHYSIAEMTGAVLEWRVVSDESSVTRGQLAVGHLPFGVTELGTVSFDVPHGDQPTVARLELRLVNSGKLTAATKQEVYIFPDRSPQANGRRVYSPEFHSELECSGYDVAGDLSRAHAAVVTTLDDACREFLLKGGKVLFLAEEDEALQTYIPGISIQPRQGTAWQGDWASSFGWHKFDRLPTGNVVDFAFAGLTPEHIIYGFSPRDFALDVYAGLFVGWLHKPIPAIARKRVGRGELLISTFRVAKNLTTNPLAKYLFPELLKLIV